MEKYIGVKLIVATPMDAKEFSDESGKVVAGEEGYKVVYEDGYISWSPKDVFEKAYRKENIIVNDASSDKPHEQRVIEESKELSVKVEKLGLFINESPIFASLHDSEKQRLSSQLLAMKYYYSILVERIENFI